MTSPKYCPSYWDLVKTEYIQLRAGCKTQPASDSCYMEYLNFFSVKIYAVFYVLRSFEKKFAFLT